MVTADTITADELRALMNNSAAPGLIRGAARGALTSPDKAYAQRAKQRCADYLNKRAAENARTLQWMPAVRS